MTDAERQAMSDSFEAHAQSVGTTTAGGFGVPVIIDPSVILTPGSGNPFLRIARREHNDAGLEGCSSAAGVTWSFHTEAEEVSDDSMTLAQPSVTAHMARGFIPYSLEVDQDWPGFPSEMSAASTGVTTT